ncbi:MAG: tail fiber protein, partial [Bacteroidota bacterium]
MKNASQIYVKKLFWLAMLPYLVIGGFFLSSTFNRVSADQEVQASIASPALPTSTVDVQGNDPFIGEIIMFAGNFAPRGWAFCDGTILPISQNQALFAILGTTYGGDGRTTFA